MSFLKKINQKTPEVRKQNRDQFRSWMKSDSCLRLISLLFAVLVWFAVCTTVDSDTTRTITDVPVQVNLTGSIAEKNGLNVIDDEQRYVDIRIKGKTFEVGKLTADNFHATLSVTDVTKAGVYTDLPINVERVDTPYEFTILSISPSTMSVEFDNIKTQTYELEVSIPNVEAASGYLINAYNVTPGTISISGPESIVNTISRCVVENDDTTVLNQSANLVGTLHLYDESGQEIVSDYLSYEHADYTISVPIYKKESLPLVYSFVNVPEGINTELLDMSIEPSHITVAIPVGASNSITEINVGQIDFRKMDLNKSWEFDISLLAGYINLDETVTASVSFHSEDYEKVYLSSSNIVLTNIPYGYEAEILSELVSDIRIVGKTDVVTELSSADLLITADLSSVSIAAGEQRVPVTVTTLNTEQAWAIGEKSILIRLTKIEEES